ncbi:transcriptional regulator [Mycobacterium avium subsp. paratuberculosis S5]|nr:transcriptional regulator [Mycobacterium avium subsp. paratuberculosis S5]
MQQPLLAGVDLAAQVRHVGLDDIDVTSEVVAPHVVEDLRLAQHRARVDDKVAQQREFVRRQRDRLTGLPHFVGFLVEFDVGESQSGAAWFGPALTGAPQDDPQPGDHLFQAERFGHVVVAAQGQPGDLVLQGISRRQEQRGRVDAVGAQPAQHPEPVHAGHHHVQDHRVGTGLARPVQGLGAVGGGVDLEPLEFQAHREQFDDVGLVVDDENASLRFGVSGGADVMRCWCPLLERLLWKDCVIPASSVPTD